MLTLISSVFFAPPLAKFNIAEPLKAINLSDKVGIQKIIWLISSNITPVPVPAGYASKENAEAGGE